MLIEPHIPLCTIVVGRIFVDSMKKGSELLSRKRKVRQPLNCYALCMLLRLAVEAAFGCSSPTNGREGKVRDSVAS